MKDRKLKLRRETVTELASDDLGRIAGASGTCHTCIPDCLTTLLPGIAPVRTLQDCFTHHSLVECLSDELCNK